VSFITTGARPEKTSGFGQAAGFSGSERALFAGRSGRGYLPRRYDVDPERGSRGFGSGG
jgi:hypothetical protein